MSVSSLKAESCPKQLTSSDNSEGTLVSKVPTLGQQVRGWPVIGAGQSPHERVRIVN